MKTSIATIPSYLPSRPASVVEHVALSDLLVEFDARVAFDGLELNEVLVVIARRRMIDFAECVRVSTWGDILRLDAAEMALTKALTECRVDPGAMVGIPLDRVLH